jgi:hypothetical protein
MNIVGISFGKKELSERQFQAKLRTHLLNAKRKHEESEFDKMLAQGMIQKDESGKIEFRKPEKGEMGL